MDLLLMMAGYLAAGARSVEEGEGPGATSLRARWLEAVDRGVGNNGRKRGEC